MVTSFRTFCHPQYIMSLCLWGRILRNGHGECFGVADGDAAGSVAIEDDFRDGGGFAAAFFVVDAKRRKDGAAEHFGGGGDGGGWRVVFERGGRELFDVGGDEVVGRREEGVDAMGKIAGGGRDVVRVKNR